MSGLAPDLDGGESKIKHLKIRITRRFLIAKNAPSAV